MCSSDHKKVSFNTLSKLTTIYLITKMNKDQRQTLINEFWDDDDVHVMTVRYDDENERIGTQALIITYHSNSIQAIDAFFCLLGERQYHHHPALNDNYYRWMIAHSDPEIPSANDLVYNVMSELTENFTVYHRIVFLEIVPLLEYHKRGHGLSSATESIDPQYPAGELIGTDTLTDVEDVVMFDHSAPPDSMLLEELVDDDQTGLLPTGREHLASQTPGPAPLPTTNNAPAPSRTVANNAPTYCTRPRGTHGRSNVVGTQSGLDARRIHACTFQGCSSRFTRPSDLARHCRNIHSVPRQQ
jgi:hypothetical protein